MKVKEIDAVFGVVPFDAHELVIDVGSGFSDLGALPVDAVVQLDPVYGSSTQPSDRAVRIPLQFGDSTSTYARDMLKQIRYAAEITGNARVTAGNVMRYMNKKQQETTLVQMLSLVSGLNRGILQIYPVLNSRLDTVSDMAERYGFTARADTAKFGGVRQAVFKPLRLNGVVSVIDQGIKTGPAERIKLAKGLTSIIL